MVYLTAMSRAHPYGRIARLRIGCDNKSVMCRSVLSSLFFTGRRSCYDATDFYVIDAWKALPRLITIQPSFSHKSLLNDS